MRLQAAWAFASVSITCAQAPGLAQIKNLFTFGDSYTDTGFNPNGTLAGPAVANPLGNPTFPGITSSGGENWVGFLISTFNKTRTFSYNFAVSGATIDSALAKPFSPTVASVREQIEQRFLPGLGKKPTSVPWTAADSLFVIFDGINDVLNIDGMPNQLTAQQPFFTLYATLVNELYTTGARNFLFIGVPAIDLTPFVMMQGPTNPGLAKTSLGMWNDNIKTVMQNLTLTRADATARFADMDTLFRSLAANPASIGLTDAASLWFNTLHPVPAVHMAMAQTIAAALGDTVGSAPGAVIASPPAGGGDVVEGGVGTNIPPASGTSPAIAPPGGVFGSSASSLQGKVLDALFWAVVVYLIPCLISQFNA